MYTSHTKIFSFFVPEGVENPLVPEAVKATNVTEMLKKIESYSSLTSDDKRKLKETLKNSFSLLNPKVLSELKAEYEKAKNITVDNLTEKQKSLLEFFERNKDLREQLLVDVKNSLQNSEEEIIIPLEINETSSNPYETNTAENTNIKLESTKQNTETFETLVQKYKQAIKLMWKGDKAKGITGYRDQIDLKFKKETDFQTLEKRYTEIQTYFDNLERFDSAEIMAQTNSYISFLRVYEEKDVRLKGIIDTFKKKTSNYINNVHTIEKGGTVAIAASASKKSPMRPKSTPKKSAETLQGDYIDRMEAGIRNILKENKETSRGEFEKIFRILQMGAGLELGDTYITKENKEKLKAYQPALRGVIGKMFLDILAESGYTITFDIEEDRFGTKNKKIIMLKGGKPHKNMTDMVNSIVLENLKYKGLGNDLSDANKDPLYQVLQSGAFYKKVDAMEKKGKKISLENLKKPENFKKTFGSLFVAGTLDTDRMKNLVQSLDHRDEVETEMRNTVRQIQQQVVQNQTGSMATASVSEKHGGNEFIAETLNPFLDKGLDMVGASFTGFVNGVHDLFASFEGDFAKQNIVGLGMLLSLIYAFFKHPLITVGGILGIGAANAGLDLSQSEQDKTAAKTSQTNTGTSQGTATKNTVSSSVNTQKAAPTTVMQLLTEKTANLSDTERTQIEKELIKPLADVNIHQLVKALDTTNVQSKKDLETVLQSISDVKVREKVKKALENSKLKSGLKIYIDEILADPKIKKIDKTAKYQQLTLDEAQEIVFEGNKQASLQMSSTDPEELKRRLEKFNEEDVFQTLLVVEKDGTVLRGKSGEKTHLYDQIKPEIIEALKTDAAKIERYQLVMSSLQTEDDDRIPKSFQSNFQSLTHGDIDINKLFENLDRSLAGADIDNSVKQYLSNPNSQNTAKAFEWLLGKHKGGAAYDIIGDKMAKMLIKSDKNLQSKYETNEKAILGDAVKSASALNLDSDMKEDIQEKIDKMNKALSTSEYQTGILKNIKASMKIPENETLTNEQNKELKKLVEAAIEDSRDLGIKNILMHTMVSDVVENKTISGDLATVYSNMKGLWWNNWDDRNEIGAKAMLEFVAWELFATMAGVLTAGAGAYAVNAVGSIRFLRLAARMRKLMGTGKFARYTGSAIKGATKWGVGFNTGYLSVKGIQSRENGGNFSDPFKDTSAWVDGIMFGAGHGILKQLYRGLGLIRKPGEGIMKGVVGKGGAKIALAGTTFSGAEIMSNVVLGEGTWDEESLQKVAMMMLLHGTARKAEKGRIGRKTTSGSESEKKLFFEKLSNGGVALRNIPVINWGVRVTDYFGITTGAKYSSGRIRNFLYGMTIGDLRHACTGETKMQIAKQIAKKLASRGIPLGIEIFTNGTPENVDWLIFGTGLGRGIIYSAILKVANSDNKSLTSPGDVAMAIAESARQAIF